MQWSCDIASSLETDLHGCQVQRFCVWKYVHLEQDKLVESQWLIGL